MACSVTLNHIGEYCGNSMGGIISMWVANRADAKPTEVSGKYSATTTDGTFFRIEFPKSTGSITSTYNINNETRTFYVSSDITVQIPNLDEETNKTLDEMVRGNLAVVVKTNVGKYWGFGLDSGVLVTTANGQSGQQLADLQGYNLTLQDTSNKLPLEVDATVAAALEQIVATTA